MNIQILPPRTPVTEPKSGLATREWWRFFNSITPAALQTGVMDGSNAAPGLIGEIISQNVPAGSAVALTSGVASDVAILPLQAGDYDVWGNIVFAAAGSTTASAFAAWISEASATMPTLPNAGAYSALAGLSFAAGVTQALAAGTQRVNLSATGNVYLSAKASFAVSTMGAYGFIAARRRR